MPHLQVRPEEKTSLLIFLIWSDSINQKIIFHPFKTPIMFFLFADNSNCLRTYIHRDVAAFAAVPAASIRTLEP